jgi:hypothetical protein
MGVPNANPPADGVKGKSLCPKKILKSNFPIKKIRVEQSIRQFTRIHQVVAHGKPSRDLEHSAFARDLLFDLNADFGTRFE